MLRVEPDQDFPEGSTSRQRRKSMDPVSEFIHLEQLPNPGCRFELLDILGTGMTSKVYLAIDKQKGNKVAVKVISNIAENLMEIESEYRVLSTVGGQSLIPEFHGAYLNRLPDSKKELWFVMELCEGVPVSVLLQWLKNEGKVLKEQEIAALLKAFLTAIHHLHENDIIHRDIRSSNFILSPDGKVNLIDYGTCALVKRSEGKAYSSIGSPYWMAPEVIACEQIVPYTKACDVWSIGIVAIELAELQPPLCDIHPVRAMYQIARNPPLSLKKVTEWSELFKDFINECLVKNSDHRPCIAELMLHPFITEVDPLEQDLSLEEHLEEKFVPTIGEKAKKILERIGKIISDHLSPAASYTPTNPVVKNGYLKTSTNLPYCKLLPDDLASIENPTEENVTDLLYHRFIANEIYTYIGDILVAFNPRKELPIYEKKIEADYNEKARSDNPPHIFAVADRAYQQMLHHQKSQAIILFGEHSSGKSFLAKHLINHLVFLSLHNGMGMVDKIQQLCPLLDAFGNAQTTSNFDASRHFKTVSVSFTKIGKITGAILHAKLLDTLRIINHLPHECNFHIFYYVYEGLKSEKRLKEFYLDEKPAYTSLPYKDKKDSKNLLLGYKFICSAFRVCSFTDEEITAIFHVIAAVLLLGEISFTKTDAAAVSANSSLLSLVSKNLCIDAKKLEDVFKAEKNVSQMEKKKKSCMQILYIILYEWIVHMLNRQLSFSRLILGESYSVSVIDPPGFQTSEHSSIFHLFTNVINDYLHNFVQQLLFYNELKEYKEEGVDIPFKQENLNIQEMNLHNLIASEKCLLDCLGKANKLAQSGDGNWEESLKVLNKDQLIKIEGNKLTINHSFEKVCYETDMLVGNNKNIFLPDFISVLRTSSNSVIANIFNQVKDQNLSKSEELHALFPKLFDDMIKDFPHLVVSLNLAATHEVTYDPNHIIKKIRTYNLIETILLRQQGYARRLTFSEFLNRYKYLAFDFDEEVELTKENCCLLLIRLKIDGWKVGLNKIFLKYYTEEYLSRLYETHVKKIIKIQAIARRFIVKARQKKQCLRNI